MKSYFILPVLLLLAACGAKKTNQPETMAEAGVESLVGLNAAQLQNAGIVLGKPESITVSATLRLNGTIEAPPQNRISISFPLGGYLKSSKLLPGMPVQKGDVLAVMEDVQYVQLQQDYLLAKSRLELLKNEFQRQQQLNTDKSNSDKVFQQAAHDYESQQIILRALEEKLKLIGLDPVALTPQNISRSVSVRAPVRGFISKVNANTGQYAQPTDVLFELLNPDDFHLTLTVFEKDLARLSPGQKVLAFTNDHPEKKYPAEILLVNKSLDENRAAELHCHFTGNEHSGLAPGMFMNAEVALAPQAALVVPEAAVVRWQDKHYVFVAAGDQQYRISPVTPGVIQNGMVQIIPEEPLEGKELVLQNAYTLLMKMKNTAEE